MINFQRQNYEKPINVFPKLKLYLLWNHKNISVCSICCPRILVPWLAGNVSPCRSNTSCFIELIQFSVHAQRDPRLSTKDTVSEPVFPLELPMVEAGNRSEN